MYDALTGRFTFPCPARGETRVTLSAFRQLERLPGAAHPAVFQVLFACACGEEHEGLVTHDDLDWAPLGLQGGVFYNLMTSRLDLVDSELSDLAARRIQAGEWPWSFFCYPEERPRPVFPSAFFLLAPGDGSLGVALEEFPNEVARCEPLRFGAGKCGAGVGPGAGVGKHSMLVAVLSPRHAVRMPRPHDAMRLVVHIGRLELASGFDAAIKRCVPQRDRPVFRVVVERHHGDARTCGRPEDECAGHMALREGAYDAQPPVRRAQLVTTVRYPGAALADDDVRLRERLRNHKHRRARRKK